MKMSHVVDREKMKTKEWDDNELLLRLRWNGVNFYEFVLPNGKTIVMDPYFDDPNDPHNEYKYTPTDKSAGEWIHGADVIVLTHGHFDHTGDLHSVLEHYPEAHIIIPEHTIPSVIVDQNIDYFSHYFTEAGAHDRFDFPGFTMETCRSNHNVGRAVSPLNGAGGSLYKDSNGKVDFYQLYKWIYERELINLKITTDEGFQILLWNSEMQPDGMGFETRAYFYRDAKPDLFMYQTAGRSFGGDRRHPNCEPMGKWIASVKAKSALPEHQQHFSYDELDKMAEKFSEICNAEQQSTSFLTPESGVWYGYSKNAEGEIEISRILHEMKG